MISVLGFRRIVILAVFLGLNAFFGAFLYLYLYPQKISKQAELSALKGKISTVQSDISRMQVEFDQLSSQQAEFEKLRAHGFFNNQDRQKGEQIFKKIQEQSGVISAAASMQKYVVEENAEAQKSEHKVLASRINIKIKAVDDIDVYRYIYLVEKFFPGYITVHKMTMERKAEVTGTVLRGIASGTKPELVNAEIDVEWRTMLPQAEVAAAQGLNQGAAQ
ncbi:MAG: hypothetical protein WBK77_00510 [Alphaproteobacteria bacterium]